MDFLAASTWIEALAHKAERPDAVAISGGTDLMVDINFDRRRPEALLDLNGIAELREWRVEDGAVRIGAAVPFTRIIDEIGALVPGLAIASRTVGSPQIRNRGTLGGNLATASPAGDALPPLVVGDAVVSVESVRGAREVPVREFFTGPKRSVLEPDELIRSVSIPPAAGPQQFAKVGTRNAMVISVCSFALALDPQRRTVAGCIGSAGPTVLPTPEAEAFLADELDWDADLDNGLVDRFGELAAAHARPIDDVRGSADYRRHAVGVLAPTNPALDVERVPGGNGVRVIFDVNGEQQVADDVWPGESLLYVLRERLGLPGTKNACEQGECGSCSVYLDGALVCACLVAAAQAQGRDVRTVEGLAEDGELHPIQQAFVDTGAVQCGFCTPGLIVATHDLLHRVPAPTDPEIREALAGNLCRCTGYEKILDAVRLAAARQAAAS